MRAIAEALSEVALRTQDPAALLAHVRIALGRQIVQDIAGLAEEVPVITIEPELEQLLQGSGQGAGNLTPGLEPGLAERLQRQVAEAARRLEGAGEPAVLLTPPTLRATLARFLRAGIPGLHVLAWNEIPDSRRVRLVTAIGR
jgi:flagellar biosynthesis protein FlhA